MKPNGMSSGGLLLLATYSVVYWSHRRAEAGIIALKFQNLWTLKQALIASKLPVAQQFVLLPGLTITNATTARPASTVATTRPATTLASTTRPPTVTTTRPANTTTTTIRPNTIISIQQLFPGGQFGQLYPPETIYFPGGAIPGQSTGISFPPGSFGAGQFGISPGQQGLVGQQGTIIPGQQPQQIPGAPGSGGQLTFPQGAVYPPNNGQQYPLSQSPLASPPQLFPGGQLYPPNGLPGGVMQGPGGQFPIPGGGIAKYARSAG